MPLFLTVLLCSCSPRQPPLGSSGGCRHRAVIRSALARFVKLATRLRPTSNAGLPLRRCSLVVPTPSGRVSEANEAVVGRRSVDFCRHSGRRAARAVPSWLVTALPRHGDFRTQLAPPDAAGADGAGFQPEMELNKTRSRMTPCAQKLNKAALKKRRPR